MKKNMGNTDRVVRILIAIIIGLLYYSDIINGAFGAIALVLALVFVATSFLGFCPLYRLVGFSTCPTKQKE